MSLDCMRVISWERGECLKRHPGKIIAKEACMRCPHNPDKADPFADVPRPMTDPAAIELIQRQTGGCRGCGDGNSR